MRDLTIIMDHTRGRPANLLEAIAARGVTVHAGCLFSRIDERVAHVAVDDGDVAAVQAAATETGCVLADAAPVRLRASRVRGWRRCHGPADRRRRRDRHRRLLRRERRRGDEHHRPRPGDKTLRRKLSVPFRRHRGKLMRPV